MQACAQAGVSTDKVIVPEIHHKNVPTIDLVDLPGMTIDEDDNRSADVEKIIHEQLAEDAEGGRCSTWPSSRLTARTGRSR